MSDVPDLPAAVSLIEQDGDRDDQERGSSSDRTDLLQRED